MSGGRDLDACRAAMARGSLSFNAASRLLPVRVRAPALALYAYCRQADDAADCAGAGAESIAALRRQLDRIYRGRPGDDPAERAFAQVVAQCGLPRALPEALVEGFDWDLSGRRYRDIGALRSYAARVAGTVGAMMCLVMGVRDRDALARACDLGVAMQLTNIARDVAEDWEAGRLYLPLDWLAAAGIAPGRLEAAGPERLGPVIGRLLDEADRLYARGAAGVAALPPSCRPAIFAALLIYRAIGGHVRRAPGVGRARTGSGEKAALAALALARSGVASVLPRSAVLHAAPLPETAFLVEAAAGPARPSRWGEGRSGTVLGLLAQLAAQDRAGRGLAPHAARAT